MSKSRKSLQKPLSCQPKSEQQRNKMTTILRQSALRFHACLVQVQPSLGSRFRRFPWLPPQWCRGTASARWCPGQLEQCESGLRHAGAAKPKCHAGCGICRPTAALRWALGPTLAMLTVCRSSSKAGAPKMAPANESSKELLQVVHGVGSIWKLWFVSAPCLFNLITLRGILLAGCLIPTHAATWDGASMQPRVSPHLDHMPGMRCAGCGFSVTSLPDR